MKKLITIYYNNNKFAFYGDRIQKTNDSTGVWLSQGGLGSILIDNKFFKHNLRFDRRYDGNTTTQLYYKLISQDD